VQNRCPHRLRWRLLDHRFYLLISVWRRRLLAGARIDL
jgi:hypothetical protein